MEKQKLIMAARIFRTKPKNINSMHVFFFHIFFFNKTIDKTKEVNVRLIGTINMVQPKLCFVPNRAERRFTLFNHKSTAEFPHNYTVRYLSKMENESARAKSYSCSECVISFSHGTNHAFS